MLTKDLHKVYQYIYERIKNEIPEYMPTCKNHVIECININKDGSLYVEWRAGNYSIGEYDIDDGEFIITQAELNRVLYETI